MTSTVKAAQSTRASPAVWVAVVGIGLLLLLLAVSSQDSVNLGGRADPRGSGPEGMLASRLFVERADGSVELDVYVPSEQVDVAILPRQELAFGDPDTGVDSSNDEDAPRIFESWEPLLRWVEEGGVLITEQDVPGGPTSLTRQENLDVLERLDQGICTLPALESVELVVPRSYVPVEVDETQSCFGTNDEALVAAVRRGDGQIVRIATLEPFFNRSFGEANNAAFFARLIGIDGRPHVGFVPEAPIRFVENPGGEFEFFAEDIEEDIEVEAPNGDDLEDSFAGDSDDIGGAGDGGASGAEGSGSDGTSTRGDPPGRAGGGQSGLLQLIPQAVLALLAGLTAAAALYAYAKSRRLGSPVEEAIPIELPGSSFVEALGRLYQRAENPNARSAAIMRSSLRTTLTRRGGMPVTTPVDEIAETLAAPHQKAAVQRLLDGPAPVHDDEFVALAKELAETRERVDQHGLLSLQADDGTDSPAPQPLVLTPKGTSP